MKSFGDAFWQYDFNPVELLVRAGRISPPDPDPYEEVQLPNGEMYRIKEGDHLIVRYRKQHKMSEDRRNRIANLETREAELRRRVSETGSEEDAQALSRTQRQLESLRAPRYSSASIQFQTALEDHPDYNVIELDLGVIEKEVHDLSEGFLQRVEEAKARKRQELSGD